MMLDLKPLVLGAEQLKVYRGNGCIKGCIGDHETTTYVALNPTNQKMAGYPGRRGRPETLDLPTQVTPNPGLLEGGREERMDGWGREV